MLFLVLNFLKTPYKFDNKCYNNSSISRFEKHFSVYCIRFIYSVTRKEVWEAAIESMAIASKEVNFTRNI